MTDKATQDLLRRSEILKNAANQLFDGEESIRCVYGLLHAASEILKESRKKDYKDAVGEAVAILLHLENCTGCVSEDNNKDEEVPKEVVGSWSSLTSNIGVNPNRGTKKNDR